MRRLASRILPLVVLALGLAGCFQNEVVININPDGSGTIVETFLLTPAALEQMRAMQMQFSDDGEEFSLLDKDELTAQAAQFGDGVRFVSVTPLKSDAGEGEEQERAGESGEAAHRVRGRMKNVCRFQYRLFPALIVYRRSASKRLVGGMPSVAVVV